MRLNCAVAVGQSQGVAAGLAALAQVDPSTPRWTAVAAFLQERDGKLELAAQLYAQAARDASNLPERHHQTLQAARLNALLRER